MKSPEQTETCDGSGAGDAEAHVPTSVVLAHMLDTAPGPAVTLAWLVERLGTRSFGVIMLLIALIGMVPGIGTVAAFLLALPAIQMILARKEPVLPRFVAERQISTARLARLVARLVPVLAWLERFVRSRWHTPFAATQRVLGLVMLLLGATILSPIPFIHVVPLLAIMLLAFAFLEGDGVLLCIALAAALLSIVVTIAALWGTVEAGLQI